MSEPLEIVRYDPAWPGAFALERDRIAATLGDLAVRIEHHGSTAVPGLAAKPVIDIQVSVRRLHPIGQYEPGLVRLGYVHVPHADDAFCPFFHRPAAWPHSHHVHVVEAGGSEERRTLAFRDYLREHQAVAIDYRVLKERLAARHDAEHPATQQAYVDGKTEFVTRTTERALAEGYPRGIEPLRRNGSRPPTIGG